MSGMRTAIFSVCHRCGFEIRRYPIRNIFTNEDYRRVAIMRSAGVSTVLDVGANEGQYGRCLWEMGFSGRLISFEPVRRTFTSLERASHSYPGWECRKMALGDDDSTLMMNVSEWSTFSSLLPAKASLTEHEQNAKIVSQESVPVHRLDSIADELLGADDRVWLKMDVQGYHQAVLNGARKTLPRIIGVEVELGFSALYEGEATFLDIYRMLADDGFRVVSLTNGASNPNTGCAVQFDCIFLRDIEGGSSREVSAVSS